MSDRIGRIEGDRLEAIGDSAGFSTTDPGIIALKDSIRERYCEIAGWAEAGTRALGLNGIANLWARGRAGSGCYSGPPPGLTIELPPGGFEGGQCPELYQIRLNWEKSNGTSGVTNHFVYGPISNIEVRNNPNQGGSQLLTVYHSTLEGGSGFTNVETTIFGRTFLSWSVHTIQKAGGGPDDCGNAPGKGPDYPPGEELPPNPPAPGDRLGQDGDRRVEVDINGTPTPIDIPESAPEYLGPDGVRVCFGTRCYTITPEGDVWGDEPGAKPTEDPAPPTPDEDRERMKEDLDCIKDLLTVPIEGEVIVESCAPESEVVQPYSGEGMIGIVSMLTAITAAMSTRLLEFCEEDGDMDLVREFVDDIGPAMKREFYDVPLPQGSLFIDVECNTSFTAYAINASGQSGVGDIQGRFAQVSLLNDDGNDVVVIKTYVQYYSIQRYQVPEPPVVVNKVRISLYPGAEASVYVIKEE